MTTRRAKKKPGVPPRSSAAVAFSSRDLLDEVRYTDLSDTQSQAAAKREFKTSKVLGSGHAARIIGSLTSAKEYRDQSVCDLADTAGDASCVEDIRMGPRVYGETCPTCYCDYNNCLGHFGIISIPNSAWFLHPYWVKDGIVTAILNLFCYKCFDDRFRVTPKGQSPIAQMLFDELSIRSLDLQLGENMVGVERLKFLAEKAKARPCTECATTTFFKSTPELTVVEITEKDKESARDVNVEALFYHLESISNYLDGGGGDYSLHKFIGFPPMRWENLVIQVIPVIPTRNRPAIIINGKRNESSFTSIYITLIDIVKKMTLPANMASEHVQTALRKSLRETYYAYIKSDAKVSIKNRSGKSDTLKTLKIILDGKHGLWNKNTLSSRTDNSGRTVISEDNDLLPNEVRIPFYMAQKFRLRLRITQANRDLAETLLKKGIIKAIVRGDQGKRLEIIDITDENRDSIRLQDGDLTYRRLVTGDAVGINRQPTLHAWSFLKMSAVVIENEVPGKEVNTIGLNTAYVSGFNADFDGDEVHLHVPDSVEARAEAVALMAVERTPISDQSSKNIFGLIQNTVWGAFKMSTPPKNLERDEWYSMTQNVRNFPAGYDATGRAAFDLPDKIKYIEDTVPKMYLKYGIKGRSIYNTMSLMSLAFPEDFSYVKKNDKTESIIIDRGILVSGSLTKSIVGAGAGSIIQIMFESHGPTAMVIFVHVMQQVVSAWMETQGLTISLLEFAPTEDVEEEMEAMKDERLRLAKEIGQRNVHGVFNRDRLSSKLREWMVVPDEFRRLLDKQDTGRLINEIAFILFDYMQIERNLYAKGRSTILFRESRVSDALRESLNNIIKTAAELVEKPLKPGELFSMMKATLRSQAEIDLESNAIGRLKTYLFDLLNPLLVEFVRSEMANPLEPDEVSKRSIYEVATIEADALDAFSTFKNAGVKLLMDKTTGSVRDMIKSGARGNEGNLFQAKFAMGQQTMSDARLKEAISGGTRVTPFFLENDPDPDARGYIRNSLFRGLNPTQYFAAAMPARQTQTDTSLKTGETGYAQKQLMAACGDFLVQPDGTIRDSRGLIVTFSYGGHFFDPSRMIMVDGEFTFVDIQQLVQQVKAEMESAIRTTHEYYRKL